MTTDPRDEGRGLMAMMLTCWLMFFAVAALSAMLAIPDQTTMGGRVLLLYAFAACVWFFAVGCRWTVRFVTGRDVR